MTNKQMLEMIIINTQKENNVMFVVMNLTLQEIASTGLNSKLICNVSLNQLKRDLFKVSVSKTNQTDKATSEMDVRSKVQKKKKPFWKVKKNNSKSDSKTTKNKNPSQTKMKKDKHSHMFSSKQKIFAWIPKNCISSSDSSETNRKIQLGQFTVDLPGTEMSREPMSN